jgi:hypothetical protein
LEFNHLEGNMFTVQCFCLGDWLKISEGGSWLFRQNAVCIEKYDGLAPTDTIDLNHFETWIQIHKLPVGYRNETLIKNLTERNIGKAIKVETAVHGLGNFVRVRVRLDVRKKLARVVTISREKKREYYQIQYEKIPRFCAACGFLGHSHLECGSGEHDENKLKWGDFLKADWDTWHGRGLGGNRGGGRGTGRNGRGWEGGGGRDIMGRGRSSIPWRHNAIGGQGNNTSDHELSDTASSPVKGQNMEVDRHGIINPQAKRSLELGQLKDIATDSITGEPVAPNGAAAMVTDEHTPGGKSDLEHVKDRKKRSKKDGTDSTSLGSAGSLEDPVRSQ